MKKKILKATADQSNDTKQNIPPNPVRSSL
jgi:hypothetical protein